MQQEDSVALTVNDYDHVEAYVLKFTRAFWQHHQLRFLGAMRRSHRVTSVDGVVTKLEWISTCNLQHDHNHLQWGPLAAFRKGLWTVYVDSVDDLVVKTLSTVTHAPLVTDGRRRLRTAADWQICARHVRLVVSKQVPLLPMMKWRSSPPLRQTGQGEARVDASVFICRFLLSPAFFGDTYPSVQKCFRSREFARTLSGVLIFRRATPLTTTSVIGNRSSKRQSDFLLCESHCVALSLGVWCLRYDIAKYTGGNVVMWGRNLYAHVGHFGGDSVRCMGSCDTGLSLCYR